MDEFLQSLIRGLGTGSIYSLLALGFVIIYKSTQVISFAQPAFMLAGAVLVSYLSPASSRRSSVLADRRWWRTSSRLAS